jgi:hypothetical protein
MTDKQFSCEDCGKEYKTNSGLWKHRQKCVAVAKEETMGEEVGSAHQSVGIEESIPTPPPSQEESESDSIWNTWGETSFEEAPSEKIPTQLKLLAKGKTPKANRKKLTAKEQKALDEKSVALITTGLTLYDSGISLYGKKALADPEYECRHADSEKRMVSEATLDMLKDKGVEITNLLSPTTVAIALLGAYTIPPIYKINKKSKRSIIKNGGKRMLSWIPIFGRRFRNKKIETVDDIFEGVEV